MNSTIPTPKRRRRRWPWVVLVIIAVGGLGVGFYTTSSQARTARGISIEDLDLRVGKAAVSTIQVSVNEVGTIEPVVKVDVKSTLSGKVTDLLVREGDRVKRGQVLAKVEPDVNQAQTLSSVRSELNLAQIKADEAKRKLETNEKLFQEGYISDQDLKDFRVRFDTAMEDLDAAKTKSRIVEESGVPISGQISTMQRVNLLSPMDGYVIKKGVEIGQTVTSGISSFNEGTIIYTVADVASMLIKASINEVDIGRVRLKMPVVITVDAFPYQHFEGTVTHISPAARIKDKVKVFDIEVTLSEQRDEFRSGMTANIEVKGDSVADALSVPVEAVFKKNGKQVVYVMKDAFAEPKEGEKKPRKTKSGKYDVSDTWERFFEEREVKVGLASLERAQVLDGVASGVQVALEDPTRPRQVEED